MSTPPPANILFISPRSAALGDLTSVRGCYFSFFFLKLIYCKGFTQLKMIRSVIYRKSDPGSSLLCLHAVSFQMVLNTQMLNRMHASISARTYFHMSRERNISKTHVRHTHNTSTCAHIFSHILITNGIYKWINKCAHAFPHTEAIGGWCCETGLNNPCAPCTLRGITQVAKKPDKASPHPLPLLVLMQGYYEHTKVENVMM